MSDIKTKYPQSSADTVAVTISLASLNSDTSLVAGRASTAIDNTSNLDLDHLVASKIRTGTSPTASRVIEVWAYAPIKIASATPTYPDSITGSDAAKTMTSANVKAAALALLWTAITDSTSDRDYFMPPRSIREAFGNMPAFWGLFVVHSSGVALNSTSGNHEFTYQRIQGQVV